MICLYYLIKAGFDEVLVRIDYRVTDNMNEGLGKPFTGDEVFFGFN